MKGQNHGVFWEVGAGERVLLVNMLLPDWLAVGLSGLKCLFLLIQQEESQSCRLGQLLFCLFFYLEENVLLFSVSVPNPRFVPSERQLVFSGSIHNKWDPVVSPESVNEAGEKIQRCTKP